MKRSRFAWIVLITVAALAGLTFAGPGAGGLTAAQAAPAGAPVWQPWFAIRPSTKAAPSAPVTALWRDQGHLDLFMTDRDGVVQSTWWDAGVSHGYRPEGWFPIHAEMKATPGAPVTAIWRTQSHLDLFVTDRSGVVQSIFLDDDVRVPGYRPEGWFPLHPEMKAAPGAPVTALWRNPRHLDLFVTDVQGAVQSTYLDDDARPPGYRPEGWFSIHPEMKAAPGTAVTALWRNQSHLDLFVTDRSGVVQSTFLDDNARPAGYRPEGWFPIHAEMKTAPGTAVTALWRNQSHLDLFLTDHDGAVQSTFFDDSVRPAGYRPAGWFTIHPEIKAAPGTPVMALWRNTHHLDLFVTDRTGVVQSTFLDDNASPPGYRPDGWFPIHPEMKAGPAAQVTGLWGQQHRVGDPNHLDLFTVAADGTVQSTFWEQALQTGVDAPSCTRFFRQWANGYEDDPRMTACSAFMGIDKYCADHDAFVAVSYPNPDSSRRSLTCASYSHPDDALDQLQHIVKGVGEGLADAAVGAAPFLGPVIEGVGCVYGVIFACAVLALDIADAAGAQIPGVVGDALQLGNQAAQCIDGDVLACAQLGAKGATAIGLQIPGEDAAEVAADVQKCNAGDYAACFHLGSEAAQAAGIDVGPALGTAANAQACASGDAIACAALGLAAARAAGVPVGGLAQGAADVQQCANGDFAACVRLGKAAADAAGLPVGQAIQSAIDAQKCAGGDTSACIALGQEAAGGAVPVGSIPGGAEDAFNCNFGDQDACARLGRAALAAAGVLPRGAPAAPGALLPLANGLERRGASPAARLAGWIDGLTPPALFPTVAIG
jgi:uncharacterized Rossmann fold enzyme